MREIIKKLNLDIILVYSDSAHYSYDLAINGISPVLFHYYYITLDDEGFLEVDYLVEELKKKTLLKITPISESSTNNNLEDFLGKFEKIGVIGNAPFWHLKGLNDKIENINSSAEYLLIEKDFSEVDKIEKSAQVLSNIMNDLNISDFIGKTQLEIRNYLKNKFMKNGDGLSFPICISSGEEIKRTTASLPSEVKIQKNDIVIIDAGITLEGFCSDCTRSYFLGNNEAKENYLKLVTIQKKIISMMKPGIFLKDIVELYKCELDKAGLPSGTLEVSDLGHSIGFDVHEEPIFYIECQKSLKLKENMIVTLEPEISFENYRIRVEDMVLIGKIPRALTVSQDL